MSDKKLTILGVAAAFMVIWAVVQSRVSNRPKAQPSGPVYLIQGLDPADIDSIVSGAGEDAVTLKRQEGGFVVVNKDNYPAKASEINDLITKTLEIQTSQFVTDNPKNHEDLEVTEEKARSVVKFLKADSSLLTGVVIGKTKELGEGTYARLLSTDSALSDKVYVAPSVPWFGSGAMSFIEQELISVKREDIESVTVSDPNGKYVLKTKEDSDEVVLENVPEGKKFKSSDGQSVFTALTSFRFDDVKKAPIPASAPTSLTFDRQYVCRLADSTEYTINIAVEDDKTYITCSAVFTEGRPGKGGDVESEEELEAKEAKLLADDKANKFTADHQGWIYEIADWKADNLTKALADLVEDEEPEETPEAEDPNTVTPDETAAPEIEDPNTAETKP